MKLFWYLPILLFYLNTLRTRLNVNNLGLILLIIFSIVLQIKILNGRQKDKFNLIVYIVLNTVVLSYCLVITGYKYDLRNLVILNCVLCIIYVFNSKLKNYRIFIVVLMLTISTLSNSIFSLYSSNTVDSIYVLLFLNSILLMIYTERGRLLRKVKINNKSEE